MSKLFLLPLLLISGSLVRASEPFTADSAGLCIAPAIPHDVGPENFAISFDDKKRIDIPRLEQITIRLSRSKTYRVSLWRGSWLVKQFKLSYSAFPTGNACLRHHKSDAEWSVSPEPSGMRSCRCTGMAPNNSFKPNLLRSGNGVAG